jgi:Holliday junction resolvasome RuvABC endonuclease subunit
MEVVMIVLGLDPSLTGYGWTIIDTEKEGRPMLRDYGTWKTDASVFMPRRYRFLADSLDTALRDNPDIDFVGIEHPPYAASYALGLYALYMYSIEVLMNHRKPFVYFMPTQLKAFVRSVLGDKGKMFKSDIKDAMKKLLNDEWEGRLNNNVADAFIMAYHAARFKNLLDGNLTEKDLTEKEAQAFTKTTKKRNGKVSKTGLIFKEDEKFFLLDDPKYDYLSE